MAQWSRTRMPIQEMQEMWVQSLRWEEALEEDMATCSSILPWRIPQTEESGGLQSMGLQRIRYNWANEYTHTLHFYLRGDLGKENCPRTTDLVAVYTQSIPIPLSFLFFPAQSVKVWNINKIANNFSRNFMSQFFSLSVTLVPPNS